MRLQQLCQQLGLPHPQVDVEFSRLSRDTRDISPDCLFIAIAGSQFDPHLHLPELLSSGKIAGALCQHPVDGPNTLVLPDLAEREATIAVAAYGNPSAALKVVGVTGTNGKSSTISYLRQVYQALGHRTATIGTLGYAIDGGPSAELANTTPCATTLQHILHLCLQHHVEYVFMEVSSHAIALGRVQGIRFHGAIFTNLTPDHLDFHGTMDDYLQTKLRLFTPAPPYAIIHTRRIPRKLPPLPGVLSFGPGEDADIPTTEQQVSPEGIRFCLQGQIYRSPLRGRGNLENVQAVAAFCHHEGQERQQVARAIAALRPIEGRFMPISHNGRHGIIDYAHTPDALEQLLKSTREICHGRLIVVFGCGGDRDKTKRPLMGAIASELADICIVTDDNPRTEDPQHIISQIIAAMDMGRTTVIHERLRAITCARELATGDDLVVIAGKGHEKYQIYGRQKHRFCDAEAFCS
ncbi:UDP-N-acetylmuramoyl-L-alanyl-D-glutamate--2,6-diaminopimelate ligase [Desulfurispirillum indicum]|uniref:UDP-N-acetylmuramoyl-L-alanyl-D-glutamate--2, 6-diaminopimelate ligase n=1 Tax=Desulfurispirillum indicum TaxID=936456 RepID=UPI001CFC1F29|nr:UDP-N-acetylmuramoyl-L-alanyl-D-glutamate--2,6-diaminopimelate ligase [Desulfurispirillum indicum]UCZ56087.1 UDP-N-acetylmuramoyl-L-alanyl-D-glutamate--2,6-diaminopimelate ligase [Desulfurispirillum indicum]